LLNLARLDCGLDIEREMYMAKFMVFINFEVEAVDKEIAQHTALSKIDIYTNAQIYDDEILMHAIEPNIKLDLNLKKDIKQAIEEVLQDIDLN
jgi:hypothetical protein